MLFFGLMLACLKHSVLEDKYLAADCPRELSESDRLLELFRSPEIAIPIEEGKTGILVLEDGAGALAARAWLTENATQTIDLQYFIFSADNVGKIATDALLIAAERGIKIRLLVDDLLAHGDADLLLAMAKHPNFEVKIYNPNINIGKNLPQKIENTLTDFRDVNQRMHNKTFIVDGNVVITGGRNVGDEYYDFDSVYNFRDRDVLLIGGEAKDVQLSFDQFWNHPLSQDINKLLPPISEEKARKIWNGLHNYACSDENYVPQFRERVNNVPQTFLVEQQKNRLIWVKDTQFISDIPGKNKTDDMDGGGFSTHALLAIARDAKERLWIQTPYLIVTDLGLSALADAEKRGVDVKILTNSLASTDNYPAFAGYIDVRQQLLDAGIELYEMRPDSQNAKSFVTSGIQEKENAKIGLHAKSLIVDDNISMIGTFNLDPRSAHLNTECIVVIDDQIINQQLSQIFYNDIQPESAWEANPENEKEASVKARFMTWLTKIVPKSVL